MHFVVFRQVVAQTLPVLFVLLQRSAAEFGAHAFRHVLCQHDHGFFRFREDTFEHGRQQQGADNRDHQPTQYAEPAVEHRSLFAERGVAVIQQHRVAESQKGTKNQEPGGVLKREIGHCGESSSCGLVKRDAKVGKMFKRVWVAQRQTRLWRIRVQSLHLLKIQLRMTTTLAVTEKRYTVEEWLEFEKTAEVRHEYYFGKLIPMPGEA